jgi:hypothetical protein
MPNVMYRCHGRRLRETCKGQDRTTLELRKENAFTVAPPFRAALAGLKPGATMS